jgi:hypothetical protein
VSTVTCRTDGCENNGIPIDLDLDIVDENGAVTGQVGTVVCGPCGQQITDISEGEAQS